MSYHMLTLWVPGVPIPQGSMRSPRAGVVLHNSPAVQSWRDTIGFACNRQWHKEPIDLPVRLTMAFYFTKPKRPMHPLYAATAADLDKLVRAVGDALQEARVLTNDARIVSVTASKFWTDSGPFPKADAGLALRLETVAEWAS